MDTRALIELDKHVTSLKELPSYLASLTSNTQSCSAISDLMAQIEEDSLFQTLHSQVHALDMLEDYLEFLESSRWVGKSLDDISNCIDSNFKKAYRIYRDIEKCLESNDNLYLTYSTQLEELKPVFRAKYTQSFLELLHQLSWPFNSRGRIIGTPEEINAEFLENIEALVDLSSAEEAGELLSSLFVEKFKFHFMSDKDTSRADKPEWYLEYTTNVLKYSNEYLYDTLNSLTISQFQTILSSFIHNIFTTIRLRLEQDVEYIMNLEPSQARVLLFYHADQILMFMHGVYYDLDIKIMYEKYFEIGNVTKNWIEREKDKIEKKYFKVLYIQTFNEKFGHNKDLIEVFLEVAEEVMNN